MTKADVEEQLAEVRDGIRVLRAEAVETRRVLKSLVGVLHDLRATNDGLRQELTHLRTAREQTERTAHFAALADQPATETP
jgi:regulator of replication initiation timing